MARAEELRRGDKVLLDTFAGLVNAVVIDVRPDIGESGEVAVEVTKTRGAYKRGMKELVSARHVVFPESVRRRKYSTRILERPVSRATIRVRRQAPRSRKFIVEVDGESQLRGANLDFEQALSIARNVHQELLRSGVVTEKRPPHAIEVPKEYRAAAWFYEDPGLADRMRGRGYRI